MDFEWVAIALGDVAWISLAFCLGFLARQIGLPPLVGFLTTGFVLNAADVSSGEALQKLADLGITLLLFTVGLKLNLKTLARPQVWAVTLLHIVILIGVFGSAIFLLSLIGTPLFDQLDFKLALLIAFAMSFSSTVFVVKVLEEKGEMKSLHGRIAIGILVMQDIAAVVFLAASTGKLPSPWAVMLLLLIPARPLLYYLLQRTGHGELLILYALVLALGGAELFELVGVKDDLGALILGVLVSSHPKSREMAKTLLGFKELFLVGFFLTIGMSGQISWPAVVVGVLMVPFIFVKSALFLSLLTGFRLRARTALLTTLNLCNYSEFGLIVAAIGVANGWLDAVWLVVMAIALSVSFAVSAPLNDRDDRIYSDWRQFWLRFQRKERLPDDIVLRTHGATIAVFGMGRIGSSTYDRLRDHYGDTVVGVDFDNELIRRHHKEGRNVLRGDPSDADFWEQLEQNHSIGLVMLALPNLQANIDAVEQLQRVSYAGQVAAITRYPEEENILRQAGIANTFNIYTEIGFGFADHVAECTNMPPTQTS